ncbi:hypothetical protein HKD37_19G054039 [Glycine soja]
MAVATCHEIANGSCNLPFGLQTLQPAAKACTLELASLTGGSIFQLYRQWNLRFVPVDVQVAAVSGDSRQQQQTRQSHWRFACTMHATT